MNPNFERSNQIFGGVFLIGLAILFITSWWWPGIMFVIAGAMIARAVAQGKNWTEERAAIVVLLVGVAFTALDVLRIFSFNFLPIVLILIGVYLLFGNRRASSGSNSSEDNSKNDVV